MERYRTISVTPKIHEMIKKMRRPGQTIGGAIEEAISKKGVSKR